MGAVCLLVALTGADVEALGIKIAGGNRTALGVVGVVLLGAVGGRVWWRNNVAPLAADDQNQPVPEPTDQRVAAARQVSPRPQPTPWFVGRKQLLAAVRQQLRTGRPVVLSGLGGVGKTQLALACLGRHLDQGGRGWWLRAEELTTLIGDYAALAVPLELPERNVTDQQQMIAAVGTWLDTNSGWLLVFDNAADPDSIAGLLPGSGGQVLVTSRSWDWPDAHVINVRPWSREESLEFLQRHAQVAEETTADELAHQLGDLPLALEQARAYMRQTRLPPGEYLELLRDRAYALFVRGKPVSYQDQVATTWSLSLDQLRTEAPAAEELLSLCAFLAPEGIPRSLLTEHAELLPHSLRQTVEDRVAYGDAIGALGRYSLIAATESSLAVHRLVQAVVRARLSTDDTERLWIQAAVELLRASFPTTTRDLGSWPTFQRLLPHVLATAEHAQRVGVAGEQVGRLLYWTSAYLRRRGQPRQARPIAERALAVTAAAGAPDHDVAVRHDELGRVLRDLGDLEGARSELRQALAILEPLKGPDNATVAIVQSNLGSVLHQLGDLEGARAELKRALAIHETTTHSNRGMTATARANLGLVLVDLGDVAGGKAELEQALALDTVTYGPDHPEVAITRGNLGDALRKLGDLAGARAELERALAIFEAAYGPDHPATQAARRTRDEL